MTKMPIPTEAQLLADYEEVMLDYQKDDQWDLPAVLLIRWGAPDTKGTIVVIPTEDPKDFLHMLLEAGPEMAQAVLRGIGEVPADTPILALAMINEGWGINPETSTTEEMLAVEHGEAKISDMPSRVETRLLFLVTKEEGVYFGHQDRGSSFEWISRTDNPDGGSAGGLLPYLLFPLVTGEPYQEPEGLASVRDALGVEEHNDIRFNSGRDKKA
jgi:hypothetical protein